MKYFSEKTVKEMLVDFARTDTFPIREDYPHIEIPDKHGRLIDADELVGNINDTYCEECPKTKPIMCKACEYEDIMDDIENAPTVLEAST